MEGRLHLEDIIAMKESVEDSKMRQLKKKTQLSLTKMELFEFTAEDPTEAITIPMNTMS